MQASGMLGRSVASRVTASGHSYRTKVASAVFVGGVLLACGPRKAPPIPAQHAVPVPNCRYLDATPGLLEAVLAKEDSDGDRRITVLDDGPGEQLIPTRCGGQHTVRGFYQLSNLVQELYLARARGQKKIALGLIEEPPVDRLHRQIRDRYWDNLTRRIDGSSLSEVLSDPKMEAFARPAAGDDSWPPECTARPEHGAPQFLYVPHDDSAAFDYYSRLVPSHPLLVVCRLPSVISAEWVQSLTATPTRGSRHGLLSLAFEGVGKARKPAPYVVPGGRFNELYGWDSYFHVLGLLADQRLPLARSVVDNQLYEVRHYGKVLNANRTYYLTRGQPPFTSSAVRAVWEAGPRADLAWLRAARDTVEAEYVNYWSHAEHLTPLCQTTGSDSVVCLGVYRGSGRGTPPEVEPGHFDWLFAPGAARRGVPLREYERLYNLRELPPAELEDLDTTFLHDRCMRESGHDTTYRFTTEQREQCANIATVDLNSLLFKAELDLAAMSEVLQDQLGVSRYCARARARRALIQKHLYDGRLFRDRVLGRDAAGNWITGGKLSTFVNATTLYPLWASAPSPCRDDTGEALSLVASGQSEALVADAVRALEQPGGLSGSSLDALPPHARVHPRQWDYPYGWAPHQVLAWVGLRAHGFQAVADRLTYRWLYTIVKNAHDYHGTVPEKFDVVRRSHRVFAEYGNVGTDFSYISEEGFGWMNASFQLGRASLSPALLDSLQRLVPPEAIVDWK